MKTDSTRSPTETERSLRLTHIVEDVIRYRSDGEWVNDEAVIDAHPELAPELKEHLRELRQVEEAEQRAKSAPASQSISAGYDGAGEDALTSLPSDSFSGYELVVHCSSSGGVVDRF